MISSFKKYKYFNKSKQQIYIEYIFVIPTKYIFPNIFFLLVADYSKLLAKTRRHM